MTVLTTHDRVMKETNRSIRRGFWEVRLRETNSWAGFSLCLQRKHTTNWWKGRQGLMCAWVWCMRGSSSKEVVRICSSSVRSCWKMMRIEQISQWRVKNEGSRWRSRNIANCLETMMDRRRTRMKGQLRKKNTNKWLLWRSIVARKAEMMKNSALKTE